MDMHGCLGKRKEEREEERQGGRKKGRKEEEQEEGEKWKEGKRRKDRVGGRGNGGGEETRLALRMRLPNQGFGKPGGKVGRGSWGPASHLFISRKKQGLT